MIIHQFKSYPGHVWKSNSLTLITDRGLCSSVCGNWQWLTKWLLGASLGLLWPTFVEVDFWEALLLLGRNGSSKMFTAQTLHAEVYANLTICENTRDLKKIILVQLLWIFISHGFGFCEGLHTIHYVSASLVIFMLAQTGKYTCLGNSSQTILTSDAITQLSSGCCHLQAITVAKIFIHVPNSTGVTQWLH